jgi:hypothetical protein
MFSAVDKQYNIVVPPKAEIFLARLPQQYGAWMTTTALNLVVQLSLAQAAKRRARCGTTFNFNLQN